MKKEIKGFVIGVIMTIILTSGVALAGGFNQTISVAFNSVNIAVNGQKITADNILYNGTTYVPLRAVAEVLGKDVGWDGNTNTASINDKGTTSTQPSTQSSSQTSNTQVSATTNSRTNPAAIGKTQRVTVNTVLDNYTADITVEECVRGDAAWQQIKAANTFNKAAESDEEYILAKIRVKAVSVANDKKFSISSTNFDLYSENNVKYDGFYSVVTPDPSLRTDLYSGAEHEGYAAFKVKKSDANPKIAYGLKYDGTGGVWFKLK